MLDTAATIVARRASELPALTDFNHAEWDRAQGVTLARYWSGAEAPAERRAEARLLWTAEALQARFVCRQGEPLIVHPAPQVTTKTIGLWDRDVCEIFLAPDPREPERYFEFEVAPTGEWLDLAIHWKPEGRETDWEYCSGMEAAAWVAADLVTLTLKIPFEALGRKPEAGQQWRVNLFRCVGALGPERGYLAWQPTLTPQPNFHVPQAFGWLRFEGRD